MKKLISFFAIPFLILCFTDTSQSAEFPYGYKTQGVLEVSGTCDHDTIKVLSYKMPNKTHVIEGMVPDGRIFFLVETENENVDLYFIQQKNGIWHEFTKQQFYDMLKPISQNFYESLITGDYGDCKINIH